jgi:hypothetical protein
MSKGIVKKTPTVTRKHPGRLLVKEVEGAGNQELLETEIDFAHADFLVMVDDYVEFSLNLAGWSHPTRLVYSRGRVTALATNAEGQGTLEVTIANPNAGVQKLSSLTYNNSFAVPLAIGDYVEFNNISSDKTWCDVIRKIECFGTVVSIPGAIPGSMRVNKVGTNNVGVAVGSSLELSLSYAGSAPFHASDIVEYRVVGPGAAKYVQMLNRS